MALIKCRECGKEISGQAHTCPNCGNPIRPVVIEQTSKRWKKVKLLSWLGIFSGLMLGGFGSNEKNELVMWFGYDLAVFAIIGLIVGKIGAWWANK